MRAAYIAAGQNQDIHLEHLIIASKYELKKKGSAYVDVDIKVS